jgi:cytochrome c biogenesis protein CcmG/thiol:disulfide interchange protein DsbE
MNRTVLAVGLAVSAPLLGLLAANAKRNPQDLRSPLIGKPAPPLSLRPLPGGSAPLVLSSLRGRPVVVNFWASWCVPCFQEHDTLVRGARVFPDVAFLGVVYEDSVENAQRFLEERGASYPSFIDDGGRAAIAYGVYGVPETYFIDKSGVIVDKMVGPLTPSTLNAFVSRIRS